MEGSSNNSLSPDTDPLSSDHQRPKSQITQTEEQPFSNLGDLSLLPLFPSTIYYPEQPKISLAFQTLKPTKKMSFSSHITKIHFNDSTAIYDVGIIGNLMVALGDNYMKVFDIETYKILLTFFIPDEKLYCLSLGLQNEKPIAAIGGANIIIRIVDIVGQNEINQLIGHKNEIYDLKFCPTNNKLLLSASKDDSIRLWNIINGDQICIFGGPLGHLAEVLSIDWHLSGEYFASGGIDNSVKIWGIVPKITQKINDSLNGKPIKTLIKTRPKFSCNSIHDNYIDCIKFNGNFLITKSVNGTIKEWLPIFNKECDSFYLINSYVYPIKEEIWYMKFCLSIENKKIFVGNEIGKGFLFNIKEAEKVRENDSTLPACTFDTKTDTIIRSIAYSDEYSICAFGTNAGEIVINEILSS